MIFIPSHTSLGRHPKTKRFARQLDVSIVQAVGHLHFLWWWAMEFAPDGNLSAFGSDIADAACWEGDEDDFRHALVVAGFIDESEFGSHLHDWGEYGGKHVAKKDANAARMRETRAAHVQRTCSESAPLEESREEESREEKNRTEGEGADAPAAEPPPTPKAKPARKQQVPDDFYPDDGGVNYAIAQGMPFEQVPRQVEKFVNHHRSKGTTFLDVAKAWQTWAGNYQDFGRPRASPGNGRMSPEDFLTLAQAARAAEGNPS